MSRIEIKKISITDLNTDAVVNAANESLWAGGGVCGAIFRAAGYDKLQKACSAIGHCDTGSAVITPGFGMKAKYIIHAVGPRWSGGNRGEAELLYGAYKKSLELAKENHCRSVGFPLISAGIFGYPTEKAWQTAVKACRDFTAAGNEMDIVFAALDDKIIQIGQQVIRETGGGEQKQNADSTKLQQRIAFCEKYIPILQMIADDPDLVDACRQYSAYKLPEKHGSLMRYLYGTFMHEAYSADMVVADYRERVEEAGLENRVAHPAKSVLQSQTAGSILGCIGWHFRRDHFAEGSLVSDSIADGDMLLMLEMYLQKAKETG